MEVETTVSRDSITPEGENPSREDGWISADVAAAEAGLPVDFSKDVAVSDEDENDTDDA